MPLPPHRDPGQPATGSPGRYLWWLLCRQLRRALLGALWGTLSMVGITVAPYFVGRAVDDGMRAGNIGALARWVVAFCLLGAFTAVASILRHRTMTFARMDAAMRTVQVVTRRIAKLGAVLPRRVSSGEIVSIGTTDVNQIAEVMTIAGPGVGSVVACVVVISLVAAVSPLLAIVIAVGVPVVVIAVGPLLSRLQHSETRYRGQQGELTASTGDIVAGLRVLRGIGGEAMFYKRYVSRSQRLKSEGYRVGAVSSWIHALGVGLPGILLALVTWLAARMVAAEQISFGDMVASYGYVAALWVPVATFIEGSASLIGGRVAASRVIKLYSLESEVAQADSQPWPQEVAELHDVDSGLTIPDGQLLGVASAQLAEVTKLCDRLARYVDSAARYGTVSLRDIDLSQLREHILLADNDAYLFAAALRDMIAPSGDVADDTIARAIHAAAADDIIVSQPHGLDSLIEPQGRNLSGGQRQRIRIARALVANPQILILVEPSSAVDAHTELMFAQRLRDARQHQTTIVVGTSPLLLGACDVVAYLADGQVTAVAPHAELLTTHAAYRALVMPEADDSLAGENL